MILETLFVLAIISYWFAEGVTEGYTWAKPKRRNENKLIHPNNKHNGLMDYHGWRLLENIGIWGAIAISYFLTISFKMAALLGVGAWFVGIFCYESALNHVDKGTLWKSKSYKWHILGYDIPWVTGKSTLVLLGIGLLLIAYGIIWG
tara:strand:+ start:104 stop:544 length:441 start_codon:yes stop_codon:yes gene_type:complete